MADLDRKPETRAQAEPMAFYCDAGHGLMISQGRPSSWVRFMEGFNACQDEGHNPRLCTKEAYEERLGRAALGR